MKQLGLLFDSFVHALAAGLLSPRSWLATLFLCLSLPMALGLVAPHVPFLMGYADLSAGFDLLGWQGAGTSLISSARRWIEVGPTSVAWLTLLLPAVIGLTAFSGGTWQAQLLCLASGLASLVSCLEVKAYLALSVLPSASTAIPLP